MRKRTREREEAILDIKHFEVAIELELKVRKLGQLQGNQLRT